MKVAINTCYGGFSLSNEAYELLLKLKGIEFDKVKDKHFDLTGYSYYHKGHAGVDEHYISDLDYRMYNKNRVDSDLISVIMQLGDKANGRCAKLKIVEIPDDVDWEIDEYDGKEWVAEVHRTWS